MSDNENEPGTFSIEEDELVEGELVAADGTLREIVIRRAGELAPVARTAAVATVGAAVGAMTAVVVAKATGRQITGSRRPTRGRRETIESTTSFVIDIHRLAPRR